MQSINHLAGDLTLLYTETKKKALSSTGPNETVPTLSHLHRKLRIQKDRLMTWGLEWSDQDKGSGGDIDKSVESVGMTDTVTSVLKNIQEVLEQAEKIKSSVSTWSTPEKFSLSLTDEAKYQDLLKDLVDSIDTLYEISTTRRAIATGSHPTFSSDEYPHEYAPGTIASESTSAFKKPFQYPSYASSQQTLVNPSFARPNLSPYAGLPASLDVQALKLPAEAPPPYETFGVPSATRMIGRLIKSRVPESVRTVLKTSSSEAHVLVEYENYDPLYRDTGVPPPLQRLEGLAAALRQVQERKQRSLVLLGYFEDPQQPRIGLVYDFLGAFHSSIAGLDLELEKLEPVSLLNLIQTANKGAKPADITKATPFLEDRFHIALRLTESLKDLHAEGYSHGNLNSGSVIFFRQGRKPDLRRGELHRPTLSAFDMFSRTRIERGSNAPSINITKHPHDNDSDIDNVKAIQFDLYGLALLLLEIGLWTPLNDLYKAKYSLMDFKLRIEKLWVPKLASKCGSLYMRAVQACLRLSDDPDIGKIDPVKVYDSIVRRLQRCCLLDEDEPIFPEQIPGSDQPYPWQIPTPVRQESLMSFSSGNTIPSPALSTTSTYGQRHLAPLPNIATAMGHVQSRSTANPTSPNKKFAPSRSQASLASSLRAEEKFEDGISAADTSVQDAMRGSKGYPFREYRRKVVLIQSRWRECRLRRQMAAAQHDPSSRVGERQFGADESHQRKSEGLPRRSSDSISRKCQIFPIKLPQPALDDWHSNLGHRLSRIVERALKDSTESSSIDLVGFGQDPFTARPTILVTCASTARVKAALKRKFDYDRSLFDLKVRKGRISLARGKCPVRERLARRSGADDDDGERYLF